MSEVTSLSIGMPVWFHSRSFDRFEQPRHATVLGPGAQPDLFNLSVLTEPLVDVENGRQPPLLTRRNVPIFQAYPKNWPMEDFAVFPPTAMVHLGGAGEAPHGGKKPQVVAGRIRYVEPYASMQLGAPPAVVPAPDRVLTDEEADLVAKAPAYEPPAPPPPPPPPLVDSRGPPVAPRSAAADPQIGKLMRHPAWGRSFEDAKVTITPEGATIAITTEKGYPILEISHVTHGLKMGYFLTVNAGLKGKKRMIMEGVKADKDARRLITAAAKISEKSEKATTPAQVRAAMDKVAEELELDQTLS